MRRRIGLWVRRAYQSLEDIGLQPLRLEALWVLPPYCRDLFGFLRLRSARPVTTGSALTLAPLLSDRYARAGAARSGYFLQDLLVSSPVLSHHLFAISTSAHESMTSKRRLPHHAPSRCSISAPSNNPPRAISASSRATPQSSESPSTAIRPGGLPA